MYIYVFMFFFQNNWETIMSLFVVYSIILPLIINGECPITDPNNSNNIICYNTCNECNIICDKPNECQSKIIYSNANKTNIICSGINSCQDSIFYIGNTNNYPEISNENDFNNDIYYSINIQCTGAVACSKTTINIFGNFINGGYLNAHGPSNGNDYFKDSILNVGFNYGQIFNLICGDSSKACHGNTIYNCFGGICQCNGYPNTNNQGCMYIRDGIHMFTDSPTKATINPTSNPTMTPTNKPTNIPTTTPTQLPTKLTLNPTITPTFNPTKSTILPSSTPTTEPTKATVPPTHPTNDPTPLPTPYTNNPTIPPTKYTSSPSISPTLAPITSPPTGITVGPSLNPSMEPTM